MDWLYRKSKSHLNSEAEYKIVQALSLDRQENRPNVPRQDLTYPHPHAINPYIFSPYAFAQIK